MPQPLLHGYASAVITPPLGTPLIGYAGERPASGVHDELYLRLTLLRQAGEWFGFLQLDLLSFDEAFTQKVRALMETKGVPAQNLLVATIHTHSGPEGLSDTERGFSRGLSLMLGHYSPAAAAETLEKIGRAADEAMAGAVPCRVCAGTMALPGVGGNRTQQNRPYDDQLFAARFERADGTATLLYSLPCHPTVLGADNTLVTADWPGAVAAQLAGEYAMVSFFNGDCGDISTRFTKTAATFAEAERLGGMVAAAIRQMQATGALAPLQAPALAARALRCELQVKPLPSAEKAQENLRRYTEALHQQEAQGLPAAQLRAYQTQAQGAEVELLLAHNFAGTKTVSLPVQLLRFGPYRLVALPGELFSALGSRLRRKVEATVVFYGYASAYLGYIPDEVAYDEAAYEALSSPYARSQGEWLMDQLAQALQQADAEDWADSGDNAKKHDGAMK